MGRCVVIPYPHEPAPRILVIPYHHESAPRISMISLLLAGGWASRAVTYKENLGFQWSRRVPERPGNVPREHESRSGDVPGLLRGSGWVPGTSPGSSRRHF